MFTIETDREVDGRWIAEVIEVRGALAYGLTKEQAVARAVAIARQALSDTENDLQSSSDVG